MKNLKKVIIIIAAIVVVIISVVTNYQYYIEEFTNTAKERSALLNDQAQMSRQFIESITIAGNSYFEQKAGPDTEIFKYFKYNQALNSYNLDALAGTEYEKNSGNLTGMGNIPGQGEDRDELKLAVLFNEYFNNSYIKLNGAAWLYYTSENNFINIYPWISSEEFAYKKDLKDEVFYSYLTPQNDPLREPRWTPVYLDHAGKGFMVTLSSPIYNKDVFKGVVSVDFTTDKLKELINSEYETFLLDDQESIITTNRELEPKNETIKLNDIPDSNWNADVISMNIQNDTVQRIGNEFIYETVLKDAPWKLILLVPAWLIIGKAVFSSLPVIIVCILLFWTISEIEKRKKTEIKLVDSLEELKAYHKLLENAAKYDFLTNTVNRRGLKEGFEKFIYGNKNKRVPVSFIMGDIDYFKQFNDTYGHGAGDKLLIEISDFLKKSITKDDVICRWGGEEFIIMLLNRNCTEAKDLAEEIRREIENLVIEWENEELKVTMTFGVTEYNYEDTMETCIIKADQALYIGKKNGRNRVVGYKDTI